MKKSKDNKIIIDGYKESELGYGIDDYEDNVGEVGKFWNNCVLQNASKYNDIAKDFAENTLKLEEVYEFFGHSTAVASRTNGDRYYYLIHCRSTGGEVIQITIDQMTGEVTEYIYVDQVLVFTNKICCIYATCGISQMFISILLGKVREMMDLEEMELKMTSLLNQVGWEILV